MTVNNEQRKKNMEAHAGTLLTVNCPLFTAALNMDLQWFAAEDEGRTHDPTEVTYRKAREEGRVSKSQDLIGALGLLLPAIAILILAPWLFRNFTEMIRFFFTRINELDPINDRIVAGVMAYYFLRIAVPVLTVAFFTALFSNFIQVGFLFATKPIVPDFSKVLPKFGKYFERIFGKEGLFNMFKSLFKMAFIGSVTFFIIRSRFHELANLQTIGLWTSITLVATLAAQILIIVAVLLLILSIPDVYFQKHQFKESLKMTREKLKEEVKQDEGDPQLRQKLKSRYRELLSRNMLNEVPNADVVITNPTHYSVALEYDANRMDGPTVIAKGEDDLAMKIREVAKENGIPVVSHPPLTRTLYNETEVGDVIPIKYWNVVAIVVGKFFSDEQKLARRNAGGRAGKMGA